MVDRHFYVVPRSYSACVVYAVPLSLIHHATCTTTSTDKPQSAILIHKPREKSLICFHMVRVSEWRMLDGLRWGGGSTTISALENMFHHGFWSYVFHVHLQRSKRNADMECMCRRSLGLEMTFDAVVYESCKAGCDYYTEELVRYEWMSDTTQTYSATSVEVLALRMVLSQIHMLHGGTHPPASSAALA